MGIMQATPSPRSRGVWSGAALVLLAFGIRLWGLTATSLWYDETFVLWHARQGVWAALTGLLAEDNALPLHGVLLALWIHLAGSSDFSVRFLSVLLGTFAAAPVYRLGRDLSRRRPPGGLLSGAGAALAYALLPIFVYYGQEVRMYAPAIALAATFILLGWRLLDRPRHALAYTIVGGLMLAAHPYTALTWLAVGLWGTLTLLLQRRLGTRAWWLANGGLLLVALPIAQWARWRVAVDATGVSAIPRDVLRWTPLLFGVGQYVAQPWAMLFALSMAVFLLLGLRALLRREDRAGFLWALIMLTLPLVALYGMTRFKAKWNERYLLPSWGLGLVVTMGQGIEALIRSMMPSDREQRPLIRHAQFLRLAGGAALALLTLALVLLALARQAQGTWAIAIRDEWHPRPDFRSVARYITHHEQTHDAIAVIGGYAIHNLTTYYTGTARVIGLPDERHILDTRHVVDLRSLSRLEARLGPSQRLWLILWQAQLADPTDLVQSTLVDACTRLPVTRNFTNVGVLLFDLTDCRPVDRWAAPPWPYVAPFQVPIALRGYTIMRSGETWEVDLWWETTGTLPDDYHVFVHLFDEAGTLVAQHDHIAGADTYPTSRWQPGTQLRDRFFLTVPGGTCQGCTLRVGLYTAEGRVPLQQGGDTITLPLPATLE